MSCGLWARHLNGIANVPLRCPCASGVLHPRTPRRRQYLCRCGPSSKPARRRAVVNRRGRQPPLHCEQAMSAPNGATVPMRSANNASDSPTQRATTPTAFRRHHLSPLSGLHEKSEAKMNAFSVANRGLTPPGYGLLPLTGQKRVSELPAAHGHGDGNVAGGGGSGSATRPRILAAVGRWPRWTGPSDDSLPP